MTTPERLLVLQGPNLNLLGKREPSVYGTATLKDVEAQPDEAAARLGVVLSHLQSNHEVLIDRIRGARDRGGRHPDQSGRAWPHRSRSSMPSWESACPLSRSVSNIHARGRFGIAVSYSAGVIAGFELQGYTLGTWPTSDRLSAGEPRQARAGTG